MKKVRFHHNIRIASLILIVPFSVGVLALVFIFDGHYQQSLSNVGAKRLTTKNWQIADAAFTKNQPTYQRHYAYYKVLAGQTLTTLAAHFGVPEQELSALNPGSIVDGTTIKVPPIEQPFTPLDGPQNLADVTVSTDQGSIFVSNDSPRNPQVQLTIPALMQLTQSYNAIAQTGPKSYELLQPVYIKGNIRLDITDATVTKLALKSGKNYDITALTFQDSDGLIENTNITTFDPATGQPDTDYTDGRSFVRAYGDSRLDIIKSQLTYLGTGLEQIQGKEAKNHPTAFALGAEGSVYGVSWRNSSYGQNLLSGWVQDSTFSHNYIGSFTFGASGMMWKGNTFTYNSVYGLDPHDDSNNAMVVDNTFAYNKKHGFIMSKRCDYNIVENNVSHDNALHGFMLHDSSSYNLVANNVSYNNTDNFVIFASDFNTFTNNKSYNPRQSGVRINSNSNNNFVTNNLLAGGKYGVYAYDHVQNLYVGGNRIQKVSQSLQTDKAQDVLFTGNTIQKLNFKLAKDDRVVFGPTLIATIAVGKP